MATISSAAGATVLVARITAVAKPSQRLPEVRARAEKVRCGYDSSKKEASSAPASATSSLLAAAASAMTASPAMALVDERMSTEGTGLSLGLSNNLLGWILLGVFGLIWSLYTVYTSTLDEDEDSGLSL